RWNRTRQRASGGSATLTQSDLANTKTGLQGSHADERIERSRENIDSLDSKPNEIYQFELLRNEMIELEKRVQRSTDESVNEETWMYLMVRKANLCVQVKHRGCFNSRGNVLTKQLSIQKRGIHVPQLF
ncbi:unnamed protein product, partial [Brassica oleracea]